MDTQDTGYADAILDPLRLLTRHAGHWLPLITVLSVLSALPLSLVRYFLPEVWSAIGGVNAIDADLLMVGFGTALLMVALALLIQLLAYMFAFVILADLSAGRPQDMWGGLRRLASWKLQGAWLFAGMIEQITISVWFLGGGLLMVPFGFVTTAAYEEGSGFGAFGRSMDLGFGVAGKPRPGMQLAVAITAAFFGVFVLQSVVSLASCVVGSASSGPDLMALLNGGGLDPGALGLFDYTWIDLVKDLVLSPLAMLPTVYMMTAQQMGYWRAVRAA